MIVEVLTATALLVDVPYAAPVRLRALCHPPGPSRRAGEWRSPLLAGLAASGLVSVLLGGVSGVLTGLLSAPVACWLAHRILAGRRRPRTDPSRLAAGWELLAVCLRAGMPVAGAVRAVMDELPEHLRLVLGEVAELLALGADPVTAWDVASPHPDTGPLAAAARRTAKSGAALAGAAEELATELRGTSVDHSEAKAQRAAVLITAPLAACFLPAFVCLGVVPVVIGLAGGLTAGW